MTKRRHNRKAVKGAIVREYLDQHGHTRPEVLALMCSVSESYAGKQLRIWKLRTKNWEAQPPKAEPMSAPFPCCSKIITTKEMAINTCKTINTVIMI